MPGLSFTEAQWLMDYRLSLGDAVTARVDQSRRLATARNHSGTHLLHASLRTILGTHVRQAGSLVAPERLRFDFSHIGPLKREELRDIQMLANEKVREDMEVLTQETTYADAVRGGALAFFGDKYGDTVRVVTMGGHAADTNAFSVELCGGTHIGATGRGWPPVYPWRVWHRWWDATCGSGYGTELGGPLPGAHGPSP